ncbi:MAG: hypothetical protein JRN24_02590 [Nitrososphaerota archaeon]|nr:hypothetical protein [Nitrososphaerota archaeon]
MKTAGGPSARGLVLKLSIVAVALLFVSAPTFAKGTNNGHRHKKLSYDPELEQLAAGWCNVSALVQSCRGGFNATDTFESSLPVGDVVTLTMTFAATNATTATLAFSDSLSNVITVVSQQCVPTTPTLCTAVGYFVVTIGGSDLVSFTVVGGIAGYVHYTAQDWFANNSNLLTPLGTTGYCNGTCSTDLSLTPINFVTAPNETIAVSTSEAYFSGTLSSWSPTLTDFFFANCATASGGYALMWQATNSTATSYTFSSIASTAPTMFAGSAEVIYV